MDRATLNLYVRLSASIALTALLLYGGMALQRADPHPVVAALLIFFAAVLVVAANWGMARLNVKRPAQWTTLVVLGVAPVAAFLGQTLFGSPEGLYAGVLWLNLVAGLATIAFTGLLLKAGSA